jgi:DNA-binding LytR/AlgR family response regulator
MINCIAIDDEPLALEIVTAYCGRLDNLKLLRTFTDTNEAAEFLRKFPVDLLLLDIQMPSINGIAFYKKYGEGKQVVFTTAFSDYAVEGFNISAIDYLLKPIAFDRFKKAIDKSDEYLKYLHASEKTENRFLFVRSEYSLVKIPFEEIEYIETLDDYLKIHVRSKKPLLTKLNLKNVMSRLDPKEFVRVHRSFIVPLRGIQSVRNKTIQLENASIPLGSSFEEDFFLAYSK